MVKSLRELREDVTFHLKNLTKPPHYGAKTEALVEAQKIYAARKALRVGWKSAPQKLFDEIKEWYYQAVIGGRDEELIGCEHDIATSVKNNVSLVLLGFAESGLDVPIMYWLATSKPYEGTIIRISNKWSNNEEAMDQPVYGQMWYLTNNDPNNDYEHWGTLNNAWDTKWKLLNLPKENEMRAGALTLNYLRNTCDEFREINLPIQ